MNVWVKTLCTWRLAATADGTGEMISVDAFSLLFRSLRVLIDELNIARGMQLGAITTSVDEDTE